MLSRKRAYSGAVIKKLHCGEIFEAVRLFPPGEMPTKRHVIEQMLDLPDFRLLSAAREVAKELLEKLPKLPMKDGYGAMYILSITIRLQLKYNK